MPNTQGRSAPLKVIGLGLGRTGTLSLCDALEILGFGPCHHPIRGMGSDGRDWGKFAKATRDGATPEMLDDLYRGYVSAVDSTTALLAEPLYKTYPGAKFILTVRDPAKWAQSVRKTVVNAYIQSIQAEQKVVLGTATKVERIAIEYLKEMGISAWSEVYHKGYHHGRLEADPEGELLRHNQYIKQLIPPEKLLVFDIAEGWKPLVDFLGVPEPNEPFPRSNDSGQFADRANQFLQKIIEECQDIDS